MIFLLFVIGFLAAFLVFWRFGTVKATPPSTEEAMGVSTKDVSLDDTAQHLNLFRWSLFSRTPQVISPLTGEAITPDVLSETPLIVIVENHSQARPQQVGIEEAGVVYEMVAEAGITRFLLIFDRTDVAKIMPVRSARPYFVDLAEEYGGPLVHVGGSPEALAKLAQSSVLLNVEEREDHLVILRDEAYPAPHDAYTSTRAIADWLTTSSFEKPLLKPRFIFEKLPKSAGDIHNLTISFSTSSYAVDYLFDAATRRYQRSVGGMRHGTIAPTNVIVQFTEQAVIDELLRVRIQTQGTGKALVFSNGQVIEGTWEKEGDGFTRFLDASGNEIPLHPGQTWIEVVSPAMAVNYF